MSLASASGSLTIRTMRPTPESELGARYDKLVAVLAWHAKVAWARDWVTDPSAMPVFAEDGADGLPTRAVETLHLHLLDREEVGCTGIDLDARQYHAGLQILEVRGFLHHVLARERVAALLENLNERLRHGIAVDGKARGLVAVGKVLVHEGQPAQPMASRVAA
jgi:hypothetical protein